MPLSSPTGGGGLIAPKINDTQISVGNFAGVLNNQAENVFIDLVNTVSVNISTSGVFSDSGTDLVINKKGMYMFPWKNTIAFNITGDAGALIERVSFAYGGFVRTFTQAAANNFTMLTSTFIHTDGENFDDGGNLSLGNFGRYQISVAIQGVGTWSGNAQIFTDNINPTFAYEP